MISIEEFREGLYAECGKSVACRRAVDYYVALVKNPCYPPRKMTYKVRKFYMEIVKKYGPPPRCNVRALVEERLRGTALEKYAHDVAELAELLRRKLYITPRVAAAAAAVVVAERQGVAFATRTAVAERFGVSYDSVRMALRRLRSCREVLA
jgi:hypothetical protein